MTDPTPAALDAILSADYPPGLVERVRAADVVTVRDVLAVVDTDRRTTLRLRAAWDAVWAEAGPYVTGAGDTLTAAIGRMPEPGRGRARDHLRVWETAGAVPSGMGL